MHTHDGTSLAQRLAEDKRLIWSVTKKKSFMTNGQNSNTCYISATYVVTQKISFSFTTEQNV
jgi:hypothetical protein